MNPKLVKSLVDPHNDGITRIIHRQKNRNEGPRDAVDVREDGEAAEEERIHNQSSGQSLWSSSAAPLTGLAPALALTLSLALIVRADYWILELVNICNVQTFRFCQNFIWASINTFVIYYIYIHF